jgi:cation transport regulator ChaC
MVANTIAQNKKTGLFDQHQEVWLFGYGSLIYKTDFPWLERRPAFIRHWVRRFWQGSHDHRGTQEVPGRVVTLVEEPGACCAGVAYRISPTVFAHLDHREKNGYLRKLIKIYFSASTSMPANGLISKNTLLSTNTVAEGLVYIASQDNSAFLGPESEYEIAKQIAVSKGPSGHNKDYLFGLANALRELQATDSHVFTVEQYLQDICG